MPIFVLLDEEIKWKREIWDCVLNKVLKALQNKSCLPQRKKNLTNPTLRLLYSYIFFCLTFLHLPTWMSLFLKRNVRPKPQDQTGCRRLSRNSSHAWNSQDEGLYHQATQSCHRICEHYPKFSFYLNVAFYSFSEIFGLNKNVWCGKLVHPCRWNSLDFCCLLQNQNCVTADFISTWRW